MTFEPIIDYMVLGVVGALALFAWLVLLQLAELGAAFEGHFELFAHFGKGLGLQGQATHAHKEEEKR